MNLLHTLASWDISPHADFSQLLYKVHISPPRSAGDAAASSCATHRKDDEGWPGRGTRSGVVGGVSRRYFSEEKICAVFRGLEGGRGRRGRPGRAATQTVRRHAAAAAADRGDLSVLQRHWLRWGRGAFTSVRRTRTRPLHGGAITAIHAGKRPVGEEDFFFCFTEQTQML